MMLKLNEIKNNLQLIQIGEGYVVVDLVDEIKENDDVVALYSDGKFIRKALVISDNLKRLKDKRVFKIIFTSQSFIDQYNMSGVGVIEEVDIEKLSDLATDKKGYNKEEGGEYKEGWEDGYKQAKENTYTEEQLKVAMLRVQINATRHPKEGRKTLKEMMTELLEEFNQPKVVITFDENNKPLNCILS